MVNSAKYFCSIVVQFTAIYRAKDNNSTSIALYILANIVATLFSYSWDLYMDWGLLRSKERGKYMLRSKLTYPVYFYYYMIVSNFFLRFFWILGLLTYPFWVNDT